MSSVNSSNFTSKKANYCLNIEVFSIDLKKPENLENFSVVVKFAEKCMEICPGGESELPAVDEQQSKAPSQMSRTPTAVDASKSLLDAGKSASKLLLSPNEADDERSARSDNIRKSSKRGTARDTARTIKEDEIRNDSDENSVEMRRKTRETKINSSRQSKRGSARGTANEKKPETGVVKERTVSPQTKVASESFGSAEDAFETSPNCMSSLMAKHCFKYEVLKNCQLHATTNQLLNECFANPIRTEKFTADNINMRLVLMDLECQNCGSMDVCITIRKIDSD